MILNRGIPLLSVIFILACQPNSKEVSSQIDMAKTPGNPEIFGEGLVSTHLYERDLAISPEGDEIIFTLGNYKQTRRALVSLKKDKDGWSKRQILLFSGQYNDIEPFFSPDGRQLFFASNRPMGSDTTRTDYNIWKVAREPDGWGQPTALDTLINGPGDEFYPSVSSNGNLYFTATRTDGIGREDIFRSVREGDSYGKPVVLDSTVNTAVFEFNAYIDPKEELLIFSAFGRQDGMGGGDLYFSRKDANGTWSAAKNLGEEINSEKLDYCPFIDWQNGNFYFTSDRTKTIEGKIQSVQELETEADQVLNGMGNIYRISLDNLQLND